MHLQPMHRQTDLFIPLYSARKNIRSSYSFGAALTLPSINLLFALALITAEMPARPISASKDCAFILSIFACN